MLVYGPKGFFALLQPILISYQSLKIPLHHATDPSDNLSLVRVLVLCHLHSSIEFETMHKFHHCALVKKKVFDNMLMFPITKTFPSTNQLRTHIPQTWPFTRKTLDLGHVRLLLRRKPSSPLRLSPRI